MDNGKLKIEIVQFLIEDYGNNYSSNVKNHLSIIFQTICTTFITTAFIAKIDL